MKNYGKGLLLATLAAVGLTSCSDDSPWRGSDSEGRINLNFSSDARVMRQTRADDSLSPVVPGGERFTVKLVKSDGSLSQQWAGIDAFNRETAFPIGDYTISASFGDLNTEGFENPYYTGSAAVHVSPSATSDATVVATLGNAMVSIRYTEEFKANFPAYSASVQTEGHSQVVFAQTEDRPAYIAPSETVNLNLTLTNGAGKQVTIQPASFKALARHHYVVTIGVEAQSAGDLALDILFDDDVVAETVEVALNDELFTAPAPTVKNIGIANGATYEGFEKTPVDGGAAFDIFAFGGLSSVKLNIISDNYNPAFGHTVELVNASATLQAQLAAAGIDCAGLFRNVDKMAHIDLAGFIEKLPAGQHSIQVQAVDLMTRTTEPASFSLNLSKLEMEMQAAANAEFYGDDLSVDITTNSAAIKDRVRFKVPNANGQMVDATIKSVSPVIDPSDVKTRAGETYPFRFRYILGIEKQIRPEIDVIAIIDDIEKTITVPVDVPEFSFTPDAFARKVVIRVNADDDELATIIANNVVFYNGNTIIPTANVSHSNSFITIVGLTPGVHYVSFKAKLGSLEKAVPEFTTEAETDVPNGDFVSLGSTISINPINVGGEFKIKFVLTSTSQTESSISYQEPTGWATVNQKTCYKGSQNMNTWYVVPSTYAHNGAVVLRSVGYSHNGPAISVNTTRDTYYCPNAPDDEDLSKAAGELFLGSYSYNGTEHREDGIVFNSRPSTLSFDYTYQPLLYSGEKGEVCVRVKDQTGTVISEKVETLVDRPAMSNFTVVLPSYPFGKKAASIELGFKSTQSGITPAIHIPSGTELKESEINSGNYLTNPVVSTNNYHALATGSVLTINNVKLGYEASATAGASAKPAKKNRR